MSSQSDEEIPRVVIRDKRRLDPVTGQVRQAPSAAAQAVPAGGQSPDDQGGPAEELLERTADLQRVSAEYANYRRRVERDRVVVVELAQDRVIAALLPVLDDVDRAREHGDLDGAFKVVADQLVAALGKNGLAAFGAVGDPFDPTRHEAVMHSRSSGVDGPTCVAVVRRGYGRGDRVLRPAMVAVADPTERVEPVSVPAERADPAERAAPVDPADPAEPVSVPAERVEPVTASVDPADPAEPTGEPAADSREPARE